MTERYLHLANPTAKIRQKSVAFSFLYLRISYLLVDDSTVTRGNQPRYYLVQEEYYLP